MSQLVSQSSENSNENPQGCKIYSWPNGGDQPPVVTFHPYGPPQPPVERQWTEPSPIGDYFNIVEDGKIVYQGRVYSEPAFGEFDVELYNPETEEEFVGRRVPHAMLKQENWLWYEDAEDMRDGYKNFVPDQIPPPAKKPFSFRDLKDPRSYTFPPQKWIIPGWVGEGLYSSIIAASGQGKSTLTLAMCKEIAEGGTFLGHKLEPRPVLYLDRENSWGIVTERFERFRIKQDNPNMLYHGMYVEEKSVPEADDRDLLEWVKSEPVKPFIVFDSLVRFLPSHNDSDIKEAASFGEYLMKLTTAGAAVWVLHHSGKGDSTKDGRGTTDLTAQCDIKLVMEASIVTDQMKLRQVKVRQLKGRMHAEDCIPTGPEKPVFIDITPEGDLTLKATESDSQIKAITFLTKQDERDLIDLMSKNPKFRLGDLISWARNRHQIPEKLTTKFFKEQKAAGTISEEKAPGVGNLKLYTWVEPDHFRVGRNS